MLLVIKFVLFIITIFAVAVATMLYSKEGKRTRKSYVAFLISIICIAIFCALFKRNVYFIPKLIITLTIYLMFLLTSIKDDECSNNLNISKFCKYVGWIGVISFLIAFFIAYGVDHKNWNEETVITRHNLCQNVYNIDGKSGSVLYIQDSNLLGLEYEFMYKTNDGEIKQVSIPYHKVKIIPDENERYEEITTIRYPKDKTRNYLLSEKEVLYKLYISNNVIYITSDE